MFDALTSRRPYKEPFTFEASMKILEQGRGSHFDPVLVEAFARIARPLWERLGGREDETPQEELQTIVRAYFPLARYPGPLIDSDGIAVQAAAIGIL